MKTTIENQNETSSGSIITTIKKHKELFWIIPLSVLIIVLIALIFG